jgi:superfamily II DNA or RNA helicase
MKIKSIEKEQPRVYVSTWQSLHKQPLSYFAQFGSVIVDECHTAQASSLKGIMEKLIVCPDRVGLTGTLQDSKTNKLVLKGLFGPVEKMISTKELMDRGNIANMNVRMVQFDYPKEDRKAVSKLSYQEEVDFLVNHEKRNKVISKMASTLPGNTLVIFQRLEHGKSLYDLIETDKEKYYVAGETNKDLREETRQLAETNDVIIVASLGVFSTGINIKNLHNLIFAHPTKSKIKVLQSIGRILRKHDDKNIAMVYDIVDDLKHGSRDNFALRHATERFKYYTNENFEYKINTVKL